MPVEWKIYYLKSGTGVRGDRSFPDQVSGHRTGKVASFSLLVVAISGSSRIANLTTGLSHFG